MCIARFGLGCMSSRLVERGRARTRAIDDKIVIIESAEFFLEPVNVFQEISVHIISTCITIAGRGLTHSLKAIHETTVRAHSHLSHDVFECDEFPDVDGRLILEGVSCCGGVEVDDVGGASGHSKMGGEGGAERRLSGTGWASDEDSVAHHTTGKRKRWD